MHFTLSLLAVVAFISLMLRSPRADLVHELNAVINCQLLFFMGNVRDKFEVYQDARS